MTLTSATPWAAIAQVQVAATLTIPGRLDTIFASSDAETCPVGAYTLLDDTGAAFEAGSTNAKVFEIVNGELVIQQAEYLGAAMNIQVKAELAFIGAGGVAASATKAFALTRDPCQGATVSPADAVAWSMAAFKEAGTTVAAPDQVAA